MSEPVPAGTSVMTPREIVQELDKFIVGQHAAKKAVAIALRNRWRRMQVGEPLRQEITPKNILMIGPTGVGKTEIARRLARLANAPFLLGARPTIADISLTGYMYYPAEEFGFDIAKDYPAIGAWMERIKALPGWQHPYELMPGYPLVKG